jgi:hypothetical protein
MALVPSTAAAQRCSSEDVAVVDQYCELIATAEGDMPLTRPGPRLRDTLPMSLRQTLHARGVEGHALLALPAVAPRAGEPVPEAADALAGRLGSRASVVGGVARAVGATADGGIGLRDAFAWVLLMSTVAIAAAAWLRPAAAQRVQRPRPPVQRPRPPVQRPRPPRQPE